MTTLVAAHPAKTADRLRSLMASPWLWCLLAAGYFATIGIGYGAARLPVSLGDTDDATRLLQIRAFMAGAGWYDLTIAQLGGTTPLVSHWSRLIDLPIAMLIKTAGLFVAPDRAEFFARALWPVLVLLGLLRVLAHEADQRGGAPAAALAVFLGVTALTGLYQFAAGRIDHHNVMILFTVAGLLGLARSLDAPRGGSIAGALLGMALVIGYEPLALIAPVAAIAAVAAAVHQPWLASVRNLAIAVTGVLAAGLMLSLPPSAWFTSACDALSLNLVALAGTGAAGLAALHRFGRTWPLPHRLAALGLAGALGLGLYTLANPACLAGPYGQMNPDAKRIWLGSVIETQPFWEMISIYPLLALTFVVSAALALAAAVVGARTTPRAEPIALLAILAIAIVSGVLQMKFVPYATFIAVVVLAVAIAGLQGNGNITPFATRLMGAITVNQLLIAMLVLPLANKLEEDPKLAANSAQAARNTCSETAVLTALARAPLPPGLIAAHVNIGPYIAALTPHSALAAPYHRIGDGIVAAHAILTAEPADAERRIRAANVAYVMHCQTASDAGQALAVDKSVARSSLQGRLSHGEAVAFLEPVGGPHVNPTLRLYRVLPATH